MYKVLLLIFLSIFSNADWLVNGKIISDTDNMKISKNLAVQLWLTDKESELLKNWNTPSKGVEIPTTNKIKIYKTLTAFIIFKGCKTDSKGNCNLTMDITVYQPDGKLYVTYLNKEVWKNRPTPPNNSLGLSVDLLRFIMEPDEQMGIYKIDVILTDHFANKKIKLSSSFTVYK
ncbi:MAG: hypothetical protein U9Q83_10230 [Bacteroidota bacterium]|nr:hypothetical protein [Bacteroidota bacterium]